MKKLILIGLATVLIQTAANASGIGYVDYNKIVDGYPLAVKYKSELEKKAEGLKSYAESKEMEIQRSKTSSEQLKLKQEALSEIEKRQKDYSATKEARENDLVSKIQGAAEKVRVEKGLDFVFKSDSVVAGGTDVTSDVLNKLK